MILIIFVLMSLLQYFTLLKLVYYTVDDIPGQTSASTQVRLVARMASSEIFPDISCTAMIQHSAGKTRVQLVVQWWEVGEGRWEET